MTSKLNKRVDQGVFLTPEGGNINERANFRSPVLISLFVIMIIMGLVNLYSASAEEIYFVAQCKRQVLGLILFVICGWFIPIRFYSDYAQVIFGATCLSLVTVLMLGYTAGGSQRWLYVGPFGIQPSEFAKVSIAIIIAKFFYVNRLNSAYRLKDLWPALLQAGIIFFLIFRQPDLGTAGICVLIAVSQIGFMRIDLRSISIVICSSVITAGVGWNFFLHDYQKLRILNLLNPNLDPHGSGYNSIQSLIAIGSGKMFGKGFLQGTQTQLQFLPARHTDFIFSVFAEEWGFWGGALLFLLFGTMAYVTLEIARRAQDTFSSLLAVGIGAFIFVEFTINVAMVLGMFPVVGMPLPFFSYGGSSLLSMSLSMGILVAIDRQTNMTKNVKIDGQNFIMRLLLNKRT